MRTLQMAGRNVLRAKRRSAITAGAMALAYGLMIVFSALWDGLLNDFRRNASLMDTGHVQIHARGYLAKPGLYDRVDDPGAIAAALRAKGYRSSPRLFAAGLAAYGNASAGVRLWGVDPDGEKTVVKMPAYMLRGSWLDATDPKGVVLGKILARALKASVGDRIVVVTQAADGSTANQLYTVRGVMKSVGEELNRAGLIMIAAAYRDLMAIPEGAHEIVVTMGDTMTLQASAAELKGMFPQLDVKTWQELNPAVSELLKLSDAMQIPLFGLIYMAVCIVILNAMLMAVFERIREYGVMKALGVTPFGIFRLVYAEALVLVGISSVAGFAFGVPAALWFERHGINLVPGEAQFSMSGIAIDAIWRADFSPMNVAAPLVLVLALTTLAALYPALKAARLNPVQAINHK